MIKSALAAVVAAPLFAGAAVAGPYVNTEANSGFVGSDYVGTVTDVHVGYEGDLSESASWYIQGGPALVAIDGEDLETEFSGRLGAEVAVTEKLDLYGEFTLLTGDDDTLYGTEIGVKYTF